MARSNELEGIEYHGVAGSTLDCLSAVKRLLQFGDMAHRNPRAHREIKSYADAQLTEFLMLNHLYRLEKEACLVPK